MLTGMLVKATPQQHSSRKSHKCDLCTRNQAFIASYLLFKYLYLLKAWLDCSGHNFTWWPLWWSSLVSTFLIAFIKDMTQDLQCDVVKTMRAIVWIKLEYNVCLYIAIQDTDTTETIIVLVGKTSVVKVDVTCFHPSFMPCSGCQVYFIV